MRELIPLVRAQAQMVRPDAQVLIPALALLQPVREPFLGLRRRHEVLHLHLLELARAEDEVPGRDLVAKRLAHLRDPERRFLARELEHVLEVDEDPLRRLRAQVRRRSRLLHRPNRGLEHEVEVARLGEIALLRLARVLGRFAPALQLRQVVRAEALAARAAVDQRIGEPRQVARGLPHARVLQDGRVDRHDVVALLQHRPPPLLLDVALQQHAVVAEVIRRAHTPVDLRGGEHEPAALAQRHDLLHRHAVGAAGARRRLGGGPRGGVGWGARVVGHRGEPMVVEGRRGGTRRRWRGRL